MRSLRNLSVPSEVCIVLLLCFGPWAYASTYSLAALFKGLRLQHPWITDRTGLLLALFQIVALVLVAFIARSRGWSIREFGFRVSWGLAGIGCGLAVLVAVAFVGLGYDRIFAFKGSICVPPLLILSVANSVFEEAIEVGYLTRVLHPYGMWTTVLASTGLRVPTCSRRNPRYAWLSGFGNNLWVHLLAISPTSAAGSSPYRFDRHRPPSNYARCSLTPNSSTPATAKGTNLRPQSRPTLHLPPWALCSPPSSPTGAGKSPRTLASIISQSGRPRELFK
jgi:hypothetical protein